MNKALSIINTEKFHKINDNTITCNECKLNRLKLNKLNRIMYISTIHATGSKSAIFYGHPKIHKNK